VPKLQQQLEQLSRLPKAQQTLVSQVIDSVLAQTNRYPIRLNGKARSVSGLFATLIRGVDDTCGGPRPTRRGLKFQAPIDHQI
jgi:hypothetical protein